MGFLHFSHDALATSPDSIEIDQLSQAHDRVTQLYSVHSLFMCFMGHFLIIFGRFYPKLIKHS